MQNLIKHCLVMVLPLLFATAHAAVCKEKMVTLDDNFIWLEDVHDPKNLAWVQEQNKITMERLESDARFKKMESLISEVVLSKDKIPGLSERDGYFYNFWTDKQNPKGLWRRTSVSDFKNEKENWEVLLDVDQLAKDEGKPWVYKGARRLDNERYLVNLSNGGTDAVQLREYNIKTKQFIKNGFFIEESKMRLDILDENTIIIGANFGHGSLTDSGYPREARIWKRGEALKDATLLFKGEKTDVAVQSWVAGEGSDKVAFVYREVDFYNQYVWYLEGEVLKPINIPTNAVISGYYKSNLVVTLRSDWSVEGQEFKQGDLIYMGYKNNQKQNPVLLFRPTDSQSVQSASVSKTGIFVSYLDNVNGKILKLSLSKNKWKSEQVLLPEQGAVEVNFASDKSDVVLFTFESFLNQRTLFTTSGRSVKPQILKEFAPKIDKTLYEEKQFWSVSKDGTKIPYYLIAKKGLKLNKKNPTLVYGYGGFEIPETPFYLGDWFTTWIDQGGVFVLANIRGGGEFGPRWHQAALKENRQRAYDDFISVIENVQSAGVTSPQHTAIMGGSNGGLLVGAIFTQRPDLMNGVICQVPLLDMIRYTQLLAGASWMGEYGDPNDPKMREVILKYSPYQNIKPGVKYPEVLFVTSTKDDRVHPGHARKAYARMIEQGHKALLFENINGGHGAASDLNESVKRKALERVFLWQKLGGDN